MGLVSICYPVVKLEVNARELCRQTVWIDS
jgi:hypothetical protein